MSGLHNELSHDTGSAMIEMNKKKYGSRKILKFLSPILTPARVVIWQRRRTGANPAAPAAGATNVFTTAAPVNHVVMNPRP